MAGFDNDVVYGSNVDFTGSSPVTGQMVSNGQLLIGASVAPFIRANTLTAGTGISITNGAGTITITNTGGGGGGGGTESLAGNSGSATESGGVIDVLGSGGLTTTGSGQILTIASTGSLAALNALAGTGYVVQTGANTFTNRTFVAGTGITLSNADGVLGATTINASAAVPTTFTEDSGSAVPSSNNLNILGTSTQGISTSGAGATVTITASNASSVQKGVASFDATNFSVAAGNVTSNALTVTAGTGLTTGGSVNLGGSVTLALDVPVTVAHGGTGDITLTNHGVMLGQGTSPVAVTSAGTNGQVLIGATGADPAFATVAGTQGVTLTTGANSLSIGLVNVPNSALANSSITVTGGSGISVAGSPVSLGGVVTISASGTTVTQFGTNSGVATPSANTINLLGTAAQGITTSGSGSTVTFTVANATTASKGVASFNSSDFTVSSGAVSLNSTGAGKTITGDTGGALSPTANNWNILGGTNIDTSGSGSTLTVAVSAPFAATSLTSNSLLLGNGASNISALGAATDGQLPIGSTGNAPVLATLTAGTGISITNGAGSITIDNTQTGGFAPASTIQLFDDFTGWTGLLSPSSQLQWYTPVSQPSGLANPLNSTATNPGIYQIGGLTNSAPTAGLWLVPFSTAFNSFVLGGGAITLNWVIAVKTLSTGTNRYTLRMGLGDTTGGDQANGVYFAYSDNLNSGQWTCKTASSSTRTTTNTSTAASTSFVNFGITINAAASSVSFTINGVSVATHATNIPTAAISPFIEINRSAGNMAVNTLNIDLFYMSQTLTTPR